MKDGQILIPPRDESILHGVTQTFILQCADSIGLTIQERPLGLETLFGADEVCISSTFIEVLSVTRVDDQQVGNGEVGPITQQLLAAFTSRVRGGSADAVTANQGVSAA